LFAEKICRSLYLMSRALANLIYCRKEHKIGSGAFCFVSKSCE
jgi:hypothetical protein